MLLATVVTGNHFFIDGISGGFLAFCAFMLSMWLYRRWPEIQPRFLLLFDRRNARPVSP
jgi:membrane-associated phospholipid phosphatase